MANEGRLHCCVDRGLAIIVDTGDIVGRTLIIDGVHGVAHPVEKRLQYRPNTGITPMFAHSQYV
jgi:hypothetical protein